MIKIENMEIFGFVAALRGMRNPMNSWKLADTMTYYNHMTKRMETVIGPNDMKLCINLLKSGRSHRKFLRMIHIQGDLTAPLRWWKDYDTYKVSTVANSCSSMHKIHAKDFTREDFATDEASEEALTKLDDVINFLNKRRKDYIDSGNTDREAWHDLIDALPSSYLQKRTIDINYETALNILFDRRYHKQYEFRELCEYMLNHFPYLQEFYDAVKGANSNER